MQATVLSFDAQTSCGSVVTDDGRSLQFGASAFLAGGLRLLRPGQRVRTELSPSGDIVAITIFTMPDPRAPAS
jgi:2-phospho-L-lactate guanylyltransferase